MTGPVEEYLRQLRAGLRTRPEETSRIVAEAEDHLRESMAAGLAAGLTETAAVDAGITSFGTVRAVVRAHQTPRGRAAAALSGLVMAIWWLVGVVLSSVFAVGLVTVVVISATGPTWHPGTGNPSLGQLARFVVACGLLGLPLLGSFSRVRRFLRRSRGRG